MTKMSEMTDMTKMMKMTKMTKMTEMTKMIKMTKSDSDLSLRTQWALNGNVVDRCEMNCNWNNYDQINLLK